MYIGAWFGHARSLERVRKFFTTHYNFTGKILEQEALDAGRTLPKALCTGV